MASPPLGSAGSGSERVRLGERGQAAASAASIRQSNSERTRGLYRIVLAMREPPSVPSLDADPVIAHLDRGWELLDRGDLSGARRAAEAAAGHAPAAPELLTLQGAIAAAEGDTEAALERFRAAADADPDHPSPLLQSAELHLYSLDDPEQARDLAEQALDLAEEPEERADAALLLAECELAADRDEQAAAALAALDGLEHDDASLHLRAGQAWLDLSRLDEAERGFRAALACDPDLADAHHGLGLVLEARGDTAGMRDAWLRARRLDLLAPRPPWHIDADAFERIAEAALAQLPEPVRAHLANVPILVCDYPSIEIVAEGNDPRMLGYFAGVPLGDKSHVGGDAPQPDCVFLYQRNIEAACRSGDELEREIHITLWHETAHFFGLDDAQLADMGLG